MADSESLDSAYGELRRKRKETVYVPEFDHCFCNAILDYSGDSKYSTANTFHILNLLAEPIRTMSSPEQARKHICSVKKYFQDVNNVDDVLYSLYENPSKKLFSEYYFTTFEQLNGEIHIIGLAPKNDSHIFKCIESSNISKIIFYQYESSERIDKNVCANKTIEYRYVKSLWSCLHI